MNHRGLCALLALAACDQPLDTTDGNAGGLERIATFPAAPRPLDIVLVIDDSPSMLDKQVALATAFPQLIAKLESFDGGLPDVRIGVVSTDMGTSARADAIPGPTIGTPGQGGCVGRGKAGGFLAQPNVLRAPITANYLAHPRGGEPNYNGTLAEALAAQVRLGAVGCGFEQPLAALAASLSPTVNSGFLRQDASLAVVILTDEDDCSARNTMLFGPESAALGALMSFRCFRFGVECSPDEAIQLGPKSACRPRAAADALVDDVAPYREVLLAAKGNDERKVLLAAIVAPPEDVAVELHTPPGGGNEQLTLAHSCTYTDTTGQPAVADPAVRIAALVDDFPGLHVRESICSANLAAAADSIGGKLEHLVVGDRCLWRAIGASEDCEVVDETGDQVVPIAACGGAATPCYSIVADGACSAGFRLDIARTAPAPANTFTTLRCRR